MLRKRADGTTARRRGRTRRFLVALAVLLAAWFVLAYVLVPFGWKVYVRDHPAFADHPRLTATADGHPGDPLNVALVGSEAEVEAIMAKAGWTRAVPLGMANDLGIAADFVLGRADADAPVSSLYLFGRRQDIAFEQPVGDSPRRRNHVRFWRVAEPDGPGLRPVWIGAASYDDKVGLSHTTGEITHHIAPDVDTERDRLAADLKATGDLARSYLEPGFHKVLEGRNGGGDPWVTDGALWVGVVAAGSR